MARNNSLSITGTARSIWGLAFLVLLTILAVKGLVRQDELALAFSSPRSPLVGSQAADPMRSPLPVRKVVPQDAEMDIVGFEGRHILGIAMVLLGVVLIVGGLAYSLRR